MSGRVEFSRFCVSHYLSMGLGYEILEISVGKLNERKKKSISSLLTFFQTVMFEAKRKKKQESDDREGGF